MTCPTEKQCFVSLDTARTVAERMMEQGQVDPGHHVEAYQCGECQQFHVGSRYIVFPRD